MRKKRMKRFWLVSAIAFVWLVAVLVLLFNEILKNSREVVLRANTTAEVEEKKDENTKEEKEEWTDNPTADVQETENKENETTNEEPKQPVEEKKEEPQVKTEVPNHYTTRLTSFWPAENNGENICTASGLCMQHMTENENGWYMYKGRLAIATASTRLGSSSQKTYKLYQEVTLVINGRSYPAIVVDVCGACQRKNIIDLYVKDGAHSITTTAEIYY